MKPTTLLINFVISLGFTALPLAASITYIDAIAGDDVDTNTTLADGTTLTPTPGHAIDNNWDLIAGEGNGGSLLASNGLGSGKDGRDDSPVIRTTISDLIAGETYNIYAYFWGHPNRNQRWRINTSLDNTNFQLFIANWNSTDDESGSLSGQGLHSSANIGDGPASLNLAVDENNYTTEAYFDTPVLIKDGNNTMFQAFLGNAVADGDGNIHVYIDDWPGGNSNRQIRYDGVGYQLVPEPATAFLALLGLIPLCRRNRRH